MTSRVSALHELRFDNRFVRELPGDPEERNFRRPVSGAAYSRVKPTPVAAPKLIAHSREVAELLDLSIDPYTSAEFAEVFGGNRLLPGMDPFAMCYGGHQFGNWAGQLGDGRAINLGEVVNQRGEHWTLQLKGAGPTPYSRTADGLAVLRSSVREFLCSEAMYHLGVPTTRALSLVLTGQPVVRDMFYDGNAQAEPGAVVCRVAPSFTRFGNFQIFASRGDHENLRRLVEFTIRHDFPQLLNAEGHIDDGVLAAWFHEVCRLTSEMILHWMRVGFVHGVMNTDNMSILGFDHRLWSLRLAGELRSGLDTQHDRCQRTSILLCPATTYCFVEFGAVSQRARAFVSRHAATARCHRWLCHQLQRSLAGPGSEKVGLE